MRIEKEHEFQREQARLEAERRKHEQEHELRMLSIMMGNVSQTHNPSLNVSSVFYPQAYTPIQQHNLGGPSRHQMMILKMEQMETHISNYDGLTFILIMQT